MTTLNQEAREELQLLEHKYGVGDGDGYLLPTTDKFIDKYISLARTQALKEVIELVKKSNKGTFFDKTGNFCLYLDDLILAIEKLIK